VVFLVLLSTGYGEAPRVYRETTPSAEAAPPSTSALFFLLEDGPHSVLLLLLALSQLHLSSVGGDEGGEG
jgi:hypothetical protein